MNTESKSPVSCNDVGQRPGDYPPLFSIYCNAAMNRSTRPPRLQERSKLNNEPKPDLFTGSRYTCRTDACRNLVPGSLEHANSSEGWVIRTRYLEGHCAYTEENLQYLEPDTVYIGIFVRSVLENHGPENVFVGNPRRLDNVDWHDCHNHYHTIQNLSSTILMPVHVWGETQAFINTYFDVLIQNGLTFQEILDGAISQSSTYQDIVLRNGKAGGCVVDSGTIHDDVESEAQFDCDYQGITSGWLDIYTLTVTDQVNIPWNVFVEMIDQQREKDVKWVAVKLINGSGEIEECESLACTRDNITASEPFELFSPAQAETIALSECGEDHEDCWRAGTNMIVTMEELEERVVQNAELHAQESHTTYLPLIEHQQPVEGQQTTQDPVPVSPGMPTENTPINGLDAFIFSLFYLVSAVGQWWQKRT